MTSLTLKARETFAQDRYATEATGVAIDEVGDLSAQCHLDLQDIHRNAMGAVMGGAIFTLADLAFAAAANSRCLADGLRIGWVSTSSTVHYLAQPDGNRLVAETRCLKQGKSSCLFTIDIRDERGLVATVTTEGRKIS